MSIDRTIATRTFLAAMAVFLVVFSVSPGRLQAQTAAWGNNAVYTGTPTASVTFSTAYIDASVFAFKYTGGASKNDICTILNYVYSTSGIIPPAGAVIDARGIPVGSSNPCAASTSPWPTSSTLPPTTVLLPPGAIFMSTAWVLPNQTRIIGAGRTNTAIVVPAALATGTPMIQMGSSSTCPSGGYCTGVGISDLEINGQPTATSNALDVIGIQNEYSQDGSYVSHVTFHWVEGIALDIETSGANNSGPYTDLTPSAGGTSCTVTSPTYCSAQSTSTACIKIVNAQTKGIHGFTCTASGVPYAGVYLDANSNTIEDGHFEGVVDGIAVGAHDSAAGNVILNITGAIGGGGSDSSSGPIVNTVHICNPAKTYGTTNACTTFAGGSVTDLTLSEIQSYTGAEYAILDDETVTSLQSISAYSVGIGAGIYVLGEPTAGWYYRISTFNQPSTSSSTTWPVATWGYASTTPPTSGGCAVGSIFSNSSGTASGTDTLYICVGGGTSPTWKAYK